MPHDEFSLLKNVFGNEAKPDPTTEVILVDDDGRVTRKEVRSGQTVRVGIDDEIIVSAGPDAEIIAASGVTIRPPLGQKLEIPKPQLLQLNDELVVNLQYVRGFKRLITGSVLVHLQPTPLGRPPLYIADQDGQIWQRILRATQ
jgi:hypothetical protein